MVLTEDDFRFTLIERYRKIPTLLPGQLMITPVEGNASYGSLSPGTHKCYIKHGIKQIKNDAPTLMQYWEELKVFRDELIDDGQPLKKREPIPSFFTRANANFASSQSARRHRVKPNLKPVYYYHVNETTGEVEHLDRESARKLYCKKYEESILTPKSESLKVFQYLVTLCNERNAEYPIIIRCYEVVNALDGPTSIKERYKDLSKPFGHAYCLAEMLIHYPNLNECIWNQS